MKGGWGVVWSVSPSSGEFDRSRGCGAGFGVGCVGKKLGGMVWEIYWFVVVVLKNVVGTEIVYTVVGIVGNKQCL